jgi:putative MFS transporter
MTTTLDRVASGFSISERIERLPVTRYQKMLFAILATAFLLDGIEIAAMTFALPQIKSQFGLTAPQAGLLGSMTFIGMFVGAVCAGLLADKIGRRGIFQWSMVIWGLGSLGCGLSPNLACLIAFRIILGVGMAMEPIAGQALLSEFMPAKYRGKYLAYFEGFALAGFSVAGIIAWWLLPIGGWRLLFVAEALPALFVYFVRRGVPESPRWLERVGRIEEANEIMTTMENRVREDLNLAVLPEPTRLSKVALADTGKSPLHQLLGPDLRKRTLMLWAVWMFTLLGFYGVTTWQGVLLVSKGFALSNSSLYIGLMWLGTIPGFILLSKTVERYGRKPSAIVSMVGTALSLAVYVNCNGLGQLLLFGFIMQTFIGGIWCSLYAYTPELYPTHLRATGAGSASAAGRLGALLGPWLVGVISTTFGFSGAFCTIAIAFLIGALTIAIWGEETKGKALEEIA